MYDAYVSRRRGWFGSGGGWRGGRSASAEDGGFVHDGDDFGGVGPGGYSLDFGLELTFEGRSEVFDCEVWFGFGGRG